MSQAEITTTRPPRSGTKRESSYDTSRIYMLDFMRSRRPPSADLLAWIVEAGFDTLLLSLPPYMGTADIAALPPIVDAAAKSGLRTHVDLILDVARDTASIVARHPDWYPPVRSPVADPRCAPKPTRTHELKVNVSSIIDAFVGEWGAMLRRLSESGIGGFRCKPRAAVPPLVWRKLIAVSPGLQFSVWTPDLPAEEVRLLPRQCFDVAYNSLAWWDFGAAWRDDSTGLSAIAPVASTVGLPRTPSAGPRMAATARRLLDVSASNGYGMLVPMGFEFGIPSGLAAARYGADDWQRLRDHALLDLTPDLREANRRFASDAVTSAPEILSAENAPVAVLLERPSRITIANRHLNMTAAFDPATILPLLDGQLSNFTSARGAFGPAPIHLEPGEVRVFNGTATSPIMMETKPHGVSLTAATAASRVVIEAIEPAVDAGRFAAKRVVGERVTVEADIFADGHGELAAVLQWRAGDEDAWHESPMTLRANDRWSGHFLPERIGPWQFRIVAWPDRFETWRDEVTKKQAAGLDVTLELEEGFLLVKAIVAAARVKLDPLLATLDRARLMDDAMAAAVARADTRPGGTISGEMPVDVDRRAAEFAAWYELFPRNQSGDPARHGTFRDVIGRLPAIRDMGFDVLYFPPIHPIGRTNRKGRDNTLTPAEDDPGSPYAIGAEEGGHDAIHAALGSLDDFHALRDAAAAHGMELALDFAIQCSPDHPWLREHPEWFDWRPDGGLRFAENPPKKYEDIVNVDFYRPDAIPDLWQALRDVVAYWADEGIRIFRVDNPHTKPFAFWEWLIADIRSRYPGTLFLSEAFTHPKVMYRLAKLGFSQSYTYFTWRNEKSEIEEYLGELTAKDTNVAQFFRPNFFVNTPDINPIYLQHSGRAGFLIRATLAATLSGLWGMLQGFEFCEATPLPGREEYASSDKYEIRARPDRAPGDIVDEITRLNAIRRANPALQSNRGLQFHHAGNDRVLWFRKENIDRSNVVLVAISLDPFQPQSADIEVPLWEWGLSDDAELMVDDLMRGGNDIWVGKHRTISLDPRTLPFGIWRARPREIS